MRLDRLRFAGVDLGLERMRSALARLGSPEKRLPAIQIAGTNGKGSTAAVTEAILRAAGFKTGLFTSPHLSRFTERIRIDGVEADGDRLAALELRVAATGVPLTYFELSMALAYLLMAEEAVDVAVLETGLGGRLDATTTCRPVVTAITSIAFDHTEYLGTTLRAIAREKAGIIKPGVPLYLGALPEEAEAEIATIASAARPPAPLSRLGVDFPPLSAAQHESSLRGPHQRGNGGLAVALATSAASSLGRPLPPHAVDVGLSTVRWPGRLERIRVGGCDDLLLDCAHNPEGATALAAALAVAPSPGSDRAPSRALVLSVVKGKDLSGILNALLSPPPLFAVVVATASHNPRALPPDELAAAIHALRLPVAQVVTVADPLRAVDEARRLLAAQASSAREPEPLIVVAGSLFLVGEVRAALAQEGAAPDPHPVSDPL